MDKAMEAAAKKLTTAQRHALSLAADAWTPRSALRDIPTNTMRSLQRRGLLHPGHTVRITDAGRAALSALEVE